jgi:DNA-binding CsgD family transcriptional regulator
MFDAAPVQRPVQRPALRAVSATPPTPSQMPFPSAVRHASVADESGAPTIRHWLAAALDELDYGIVLLFDDMRVVHVNEAALAELDDCHPLELIGGELRARLARDVAPLHEAVTAAGNRGIRKLLTLGKDGQRGSVSVVPLEAANSGPRAVLVVLGKREVCESLSVQGFARSYGLTGAETRVLMALCDGTPPTKTAQLLGVAVSTIRSQIGSLRQKTGAESIRALVRQVAVLPPVKGALRRNGSTRGHGWFSTLLHSAP